MQAVIIYDSLTGNTERAAGLVAEALYRRGIDSSIFPVAEFNPEVVARADLVVIGTWTDGFILVGQRPGRGKRFRALPDLAGKPCVVFCTFAVNPRRTVEKLERIVADCGGQVVGGMSFRRDKLAEGAEELADRLDQYLTSDVP